MVPEIKSLNKNPVVLSPVATLAAGGLQGILANVVDLAALQDLSMSSPKL